MKKTTLLFGSIGTLVETSDMQRRAFNQAFEEAGLAWDWDVATYKKLLLKSGGQQRIADFADSRNVSVDASALHARKTEIFDDEMNAKGVSAREGVEQVIRDAQARGIEIGFVTSTSSANIDAMFAALRGTVSPSDFSFIANGSMVENGKPAPDIYLHAVEAMKRDARECVAVEDTAVALSAANAAGVDCVAFPNAFADEDEFDEDVRMQSGPLDLRFVFDV